MIISPKFQKGIFILPALSRFSCLEEGRAFPCALATGTCPWLNWTRVPWCERVLRGLIASMGNSKGFVIFWCGEPVIVVAH